MNDFLKLYKLLTEPDSLVTYINSLISTFFGAILLIQGDTFDSSRSYDIMRAYSEDFWGVLFLLAGLLVLLSTARKWPWYVQAFGNAYLTTLWLTTILLIYFANPISALGVAYPFLVLFSARRLFKCIVLKNKLT